MSASALDAVVVGAGPNGLAAAITLARAGLAVRVYEANPVAGGGVASEELTLPGFVHDTCSAVHPLAVASPFFRTLPLARHGLEWVHPEIPVVQAMDGPMPALCRTLDETAQRLGGDEGRSWRDLFAPFVQRWDDLLDDTLVPLGVPRHPLLMARFGLAGMRSARGLALARLRGEGSRALFAGCAAHSFLALEQLASASFGLMLGASGHAVGWPFPRGGARRLAEALVDHLRELGGEVVTGVRVTDLAELPPSRAVVLDLTPRQVLGVTGERLPSGYRARLARWRYGPAVFKVDWALSEPIPWSSEACRRAGTIHVGGTLDDTCESERAHWQGRVAERPFVLLAQPTLFDPTRAPAGRHVAWGYCHVPLGWTGNALDAIESHVERHAPGFRDVVLARSVRGPADMERANANLVSGDINGGTQDLGQLFFRPVASLHPHATPLSNLYICSSSTPPGGGVHGMGGWHAARAALRRTFGRGRA